MAGFISRLVACLVAVVAVLQLIHLVLLNKLESQRLDELHHLQARRAAGSSNEVRERLGSSDSGGGGGGRQLQQRQQMQQDDPTILDSSGHYRIIYSLAVPPDPFDPPFDPSTPSTTASDPEKDPQGPSELDQQQSINDDFSIDEDTPEDPQGPGDDLNDPLPLDLTLVTHGDLNFAKSHLLSLLHRWRGPVSLSLFAKNKTELEAVSEFIAQARMCQDDVRQYVSFHLVFPLVMSEDVAKALKGKKKTAYVPPQAPDRRRFQRAEEVKDSKVQREMCMSFYEELDRSKVNGGRSRGGAEVGVSSNLLRNVARRQVATQYMMMTEMDTVPSAGLRGRLSKFLREREFEREVKRRRSQGGAADGAAGGAAGGATGGASGGEEDKSVFVVPAFEVRQGVKTPEGKRELALLVDKFQARPAVVEVCPDCSETPLDYKKWLRERQSPAGDLSIFSEVFWKAPWDPYFVSDNSVPFLDERFPGGSVGVGTDNNFNRLSQLCELHTAGYKFLVLNDAFLVRSGNSREDATVINSGGRAVSAGIFEAFKKEMADKYSHSSRRC